MAEKTENYTKAEAFKKLIAAGISEEEARRILGAKSGPKGADVERKAIYFLPAQHTNTKKPELFLSYAKQAYTKDRQEPYNAVMCLTATQRDPEGLVVEAKDVLGVSSLRSVELGKPVMTLEEANKILMAECERRYAKAITTASAKASGSDPAKAK